MAKNESITRDWLKYNAAAKKSGEVTFHLSGEALRYWVNQAKNRE